MEHSQKRVFQLLTQALSEKASDVMLTVGLPPMLRVDGHWRRTEHHKLTPEDIVALTDDLLNERHAKRYAETRDVDFSLSIPGRGRFRVNLFQQRSSRGAVIRTIADHIPSIGELGLPSAFTDLANLSSGLVLVTGPAGSGKSTSLAALIEQINATHTKHIITLEDPIEFFHRHGKSIINQREIESDSKSFGAALRAGLRQAPDVIMVGEMRDHETISAALTTAETGHLVLATLHTNSASEAVDRITDVFPAQQQQLVRTLLANNLQAVITQQLIPRHRRAGRVLGYEFLSVTPAVRSLIREGKAHMIPAQIQMGASTGMITMDSCLVRLYQQGAISWEDGRARASDPREFERLSASRHNL